MQQQVKGSVTMPRIPAYPPIAEMIETILRVRDWGQWDLAAELGVDQSSVSRWTTGVKISMEYADRIREMWTEAVGNRPADAPIWGALHTVPIMGKIGAGAMVITAQDGIPVEGFYQIEVPFPLPPGHIGLLVEGDSMAPEAEHGDVLIVGPQIIDIRSVLNRAAAVLLDDGRSYFKKIVNGRQEGTFDLISHDAAPIRNARIASVRPLMFVVKEAAYRAIAKSNKKRDGHVVPLHTARKGQKRKPKK